MKHSGYYIVLFFLIGTSIVYPASISVGNAQILYPQDKFPSGSPIAWEFLNPNGKFAIDAPFATVKSLNGDVDYFGSSWRGLRKFGGAPNEVLRFSRPVNAVGDVNIPIYKAWYREHNKLWPHDSMLRDKDPNFGNIARWAAWISNIYKHTNGDYIGFVHLEDYSSCLTTDPGWPHCNVLGSNPRRMVRFRIGLAISHDEGETWDYLGHILAPNYENGSLTNIGGVPFITLGGLFFVYFNDYSSTYNKRIAVARASISDVIAAAQLGQVTTWYKMDTNNVWNQPGLTGLGVNVINPIQGNPNVSASQEDYDTHSDAVFSSALNKYLLSIWVAPRWSSAPGNRALLVYSSTGAINWGNPIIVDNTQNRDHRNSFFTATSNATDDVREVGSEFYIVYPLSDLTNYHLQDLYWRKLTIVP